MTMKTHHPRFTPFIRELVACSTVVMIAGVGLLNGQTSEYAAIASRLPATWPTQSPAVRPTGGGWVEAFPHVRVDRSRKMVEFDGAVCVDVHQAETPRVEIELFVCCPMRDKEMESLVVSHALAAHVHAALLLAGFTPGSPGRIEFPKDNVLRRVPPMGDNLRVELAWFDADGKEQTANVLEWIIDERTKKPLSTSAEMRLVYGGSSFGKMKDEEGKDVEVYDADGLGTLITLCTFGTETVGLSAVYSHDSGIDAPWWLARAEVMPPYNTPVKVRLSAAQP